MEIHTEIYLIKYKKQRLLYSLNDLKQFDIHNYCSNRLTSKGIRKLGI